MATKKTTKKTTAKKAPAKKPAAKKAPAKKSTAKAKLKIATPKALALPATRRPSPNPLLPTLVIGKIAEYQETIKLYLENYAGHLRPLDRARLNSIGIRRQGFTERAYQLAGDNQEFLPHFLTLAKFGEDLEHFTSMRALLDTNRQIEELLWNLIIQAADMAYTDALEFYDSVRSAAKRRIDAAESIHNELAVFFESKGRRGEAGEPTDKEVLRDMKALIKGKKDGKVVIENVKPKLSGGKHKVIDEHFNDSAQFKETGEASIQE